MRLVGLVVALSLTLALLTAEASRPGTLSGKGCVTSTTLMAATFPMEWRWSEGKPDRFPALAMELVTLRPDIIVASGTQAARAAIEATSVIPIVMTTSSYPEKIGLVNLKTAKGLGLTMPQSVLVRADELIQ